MALHSWDDATSKGVWASLLLAATASGTVFSFTATIRGRKAGDDTSAMAAPKVDTKRVHAEGAQGAALLDEKRRHRWSIAVAHI